MQMNDPKPSAEEALAIAMQKLNEQGQYILKLEKQIEELKDGNTKSEK
jgi:hypothetical protein